MCQPYRIDQMNRERWVPVHGYEGCYEVSSQARIRAIPRTISYSDGRSVKYPGRLLRGSITNGYRYLNLRNPPRPAKQVKRSRIVATAFIGNPPTLKHQVNHKNGDRGDDRPENLEWVTNRENAKHSFDVLGRKPTGAVCQDQKGSNNPSAVLTGKTWTHVPTTAAL